jgi:ditrans,polycis-polyprenyl diphosphate synthase
VKIEVFESSMENTSWLEWFAIQVLKCGPIPKHVALIMDGNRRFAKKQQKETFFGHKSGFETLKNVNITDLLPL